MTRYQLFREMSRAYELSLRADHWQAMHAAWFAAARDRLEQSKGGQ